MPVAPRADLRRSASTLAVKRRTRCIREENKTNYSSDVRRVHLRSASVCLASRSPCARVRSKLCQQGRPRGVCPTTMGLRGCCGLLKYIVVVVNFLFWVRENIRQRQTPPVYINFASFLPAARPPTLGPCTFLSPTSSASICVPRPTERPRTPRGRSHPTAPNFLENIYLYL